MPTYRVYIRRNTTQPPIWDWSSTKVAPNPNIALGWAYADWQNFHPTPPPPPLSACNYSVNPVTAAARPLAALGDTGLSASQQAFINSIESQVGNLLAAKLDGQFHMVNYPAGFNYGITYGNNAYWNQATLQDIDTLLGTADNGMLDLTGAGFSTLYAQLLGSVTFSFSSQDQTRMNQQDTAASAQIASVLTEFTNAGGTYTNPLPFGGKLQDVFNQLTKQFGSLANLPSSLNALRNAIAAYQSAAGDSYALHNRYYVATARIAAAIANTVTPTAANGGMQVDANDYYVGYTPNKLPTANQLIGSLQATGNAVEVSIEVSSFSSSAAQLSIAGSAGLSVGIADILDLSLQGSGTYNLSRYAASGGSATIDLTYPGVTLFGSQPSALSLDGTTGWYANDILQEAATNTGQDTTGYKIQGSEYNVNELFGPNGAFSRLKTFVISQQPTMKLTFTSMNESQVESDYQVGMSADLSILGIFSIGGAAGSYSVQNVDTESQSGSVTVTFGPPQPSGTIPIEQQVAYVLGGVASHPPNNI